MSLNNPTGFAQVSTGQVIRVTGVEEEKYRGWRFWAKGYIRKKVRKDDLGAVDNEAELAAELLILINPTLLLTRRLSTWTRTPKSS